MKYFFGIFDPRPVGAEANALLVEGKKVLGVEVTIPALAQMCNVGNIDPQHTGGNVGLSAIEEALVATLPEEGTLLVTVRPDLDAFGVMAVLELRAHVCVFSPEMEERIQKIAVSDKFAMGKWSPKELPSSANPWPTSEGVEGNKELAVMQACVADFKLSPEKRVEALMNWLTTGEEPAGYADTVQRDRMDMISAIENGTIKFRTVADGKIAVVESVHRAGTNVGYTLAPVVVALNPSFKMGAGEPHKKFTICQYQTGYVDLKKAFQELSGLEEGWGGSPTIGGSPQGVSSKLTTEQVVEVVERNFL